MVRPFLEQIECLSSTGPRTVEVLPELVLPSKVEAEVPLAAVATLAAAWTEVSLEVELLKDIQPAVVAEAVEDKVEAVVEEIIKYMLVILIQV